jgi:hypothetical protein
MGTPTRFSNGLSTQPRGKVLGDYPLPDPFHTASTSGKNVFTYSNDFTDVGTTTAYTIVGVSSTFALTDGVGGLAVLTPGGATTVTTMHRTAAAFQFVAGNKFWYVHRLKVSAASGNQVLLAGLTKVATGTMATTDRLFFSKAAGSTSLDLISTVNNVATTLVTGLKTVAADTYTDVGLYYDGKDLIVYADDLPVARVEAATIGASAANLTNALLAPFVTITPIASETVTIDYHLVAQETTR